jgi:hypothetical protein
LLADLVQKLFDRRAELEAEAAAGAPKRKDEFLEPPAPAPIYVPNSETQFPDLHAIVIGKLEQVDLVRCGCPKHVKLKRTR